MYLSDIFRKEWKFLICFRNNELLSPQRENATLHLNDENQPSIECIFNKLLQLKYQDP